MVLQEILTQMEIKNVLKQIPLEMRSDSIKHPEFYDF